MTVDAKRLRKHVRGFAGRFFYDPERGDIAYIDKNCDAKQCDCERKVNADGDQDCSHSLYDWEHEDHLYEPIVEMLNAVGPLLDENERLNKHVEHNDAEYLTMKDALRDQINRLAAMTAARNEACDLVGEEHAECGDDGCNVPMCVRLRAIRKVGQ